MILYEQFYRRNGVRIITHLMRPPILDYNQLILPRNSSIHFSMWGDDDVAIPQDHHLIKHIKKIMYLHIADHYLIDVPNNNPKLATENIQKLIRNHYLQNRRFRRLDLDMSIKDEQTICCYAYGILNRRYRYIGQKISNRFYKWLDYHTTIFNTVSRAVSNDNRHHFIILDVPISLPNTAVIKEHAKHPLIFQIKMMHRFRNEDQWLVWSLIHLLYARLEESVVFKELNPKHMDRINLILKHNNSCVLVNMSKILHVCNEWDNKWVEYGLAPNVATYDGFRLSKFLLNMLMVIREADITNAELNEADDEVSGGRNSEEEDDNLKNDIDNIRANKIQQTKLLNELFPSDIAEMTREAMRPKNNIAEQVAKVKDAKTDDTLIDDGEDDIDEMESQMDARLEALDSIEEEIAEEVTISDNDDNMMSEEIAYTDYRTTMKSDTPEERASAIAKNMAKNGTLTPGEYRRAERIAANYKKLKSPFNKDKSFESLLVVEPKDIELSGDDVVASNEVMDLVPDKSMSTSSLKTLDGKYVKTLLPKHISQSVMAVNKMGVTVQNYNIDKVSTMMDEYEVHSVQVETVAGKKTTIKFKLPVIDDDGYIRINGVKYIMRKQWNDLPIRKIGPSITALTSYYSKLFVTRTERAAFNYDKWLTGTLVTMCIEGIEIKNTKFNDVFDNNQAGLPRAYTMVARKIVSFDYKGYCFNFDINKSVEIFGSKTKDDLIPVAYKSKDKSDIIYMDKAGWLRIGKEYISLEDYLGIDTEKAPDDYAEITIYGKDIPLVYIMGYHLGLGNLLATLGISYLRLKKSSEVVVDTHISVRFKDEILAIKRSDQLACLIINGLNRFKNDIRKMSIYDFDHKDAYAKVFENNRVDQRYLKETQTMFPLWVDPITEGILKEMGEPTDMVLLLIRAVELLLTDYHPDSMDTKFMRIRGYERISGFLYGEMVKAMRDYNYRPARKDKAFTLHPDAVWYSIVRDETMTVKEGSNPIHNLKEQEIVVYRGTGGRSSDSMVAESRKYHKNAIGIVSEATVDSGDVGTITYLSADPRISNMYGMVEVKDLPDVKNGEELEVAKTISTSFLLAPGSDIDDPKRAGFVSVQNSQTMATKEYSLLPCRTGYERVVGGRLGETFCVNAEQDGTVTDISDNVITIEYKDGTVNRYTLGTTYHPWSGNIVTQTTETKLKKGDKFKQGENVLYNPAFFKHDGLLKNHVSFTHQMLARVAIVEGGDVFEDACAISKELSTKMQADIAYIRSIVIDDGQDIKDLVKVGDTVYPDSILCTIINTQTDTQFYDTKTMKLLEKLAMVSPKAKYNGVVSKIDVVYTGEVEQMPDNLRDITMRSDREIYRHSKRKGAPVEGGKVDIGFRVDGKPMAKNTTAIRVHIIENLRMQAGDKLVVANQLKATIARVWTDDNVDENGEVFDAYFSGNSIDKRIVNSPFLMGTTNTLMLAITKQVVNTYFNEE